MCSVSKTKRSFFEKPLFADCIIDSNMGCKIDVSLWVPLQVNLEELLCGCLFAPKNRARFFEIKSISDENELNQVRGALRIRSQKCDLISGEPLCIRSAWPS
jgi:hypothetical protein